MRRNIAFILLLSVLTACQHNKLNNNNEKDLAQQILSEEDVLTQKEELRQQKEQQLADSLAKLPKGFRFEAIRKVNLKHRPHIIDVVNRIDSTKEFKLSDVAKTIEYIRIQNLPDSSISNNMKYKYYMTDKHLVASNIYGIHLFTKDGQFKNTIVKNNLNGMTYDRKADRVDIYYSNFAKIGGNTSVWSRGDNLYYNYQNTNTGQNYIMELDCAKDLLGINTEFEPENPRKVIGMGKISVDLNHGQDKVFKAAFPNGASSYRSESLYDKVNLFSPDRNTYISNQSRNGNNMLEILNTKGDTLSNFKKLEQLINFKQRCYRGFDYGNSYEKQGNYYFRTDYNDTIFKVIPPNIIQPEYIFNLGNYKVSKQEALNPTFDLNGKITPYEWADSKGYIFMSFIKDDNLSPNSMKKKSVKLYHALYNKKNKSLQFVKNDPTNYTVDHLQNDIDGGLSVWPKSYMINRHGEIMIALRGEEIKKQIESDEFKNSLAPEENKQKLIEVANNCANDDQILMLVK